MISIIIPAFNEEKQIGKIVSYVLDHSEVKNTDVLVVDGGSTDKTAQVAEKAGARVVFAPQKGRARQMNYGAKQARGEWLYFLHADTEPPLDFVKHIQQKMQLGYKCGCFRLKFDDSHPALRFYAWFTKFDWDVFRFGDQSLFVEKALFCKIDGFDENLRVMEDQEIIKRLKTHAQFCIIEKSVITSARKYQQFGVFRLQLIFSIIVVLFYLKISQEVIVHFYKTFMSGTLH